MKVICLVGFLLCFVVGCSNSGSSSSAAPKQVDLGVVNLTYGTPSKHDLGDGRSCVLTASPFQAKDIELIAELKKGDKTITTRRQMPAPLDKPVQFSLNDVEVTVTAHIAQ